MEEKFVEHIDVDKDKFDVFEIRGGSVPIRGLKDVIDYINYITVVLAKRGFLPLEDDFMSNYEIFIESKGAVSGMIGIKIYNMEKVE